MKLANEKNQDKNSFNEFCVRQAEKWSRNLLGVEIYFWLEIDVKSMGVYYVFVIFFIWLYWVFTALRKLSVVAASGVYSEPRTGVSLWWPLLLRSSGARRLRSCGARAQLLRGMWNLPGPGIKPVSPALAGGFLTTEPSRGVFKVGDIRHHGGTILEMSQPLYSEENDFEFSLSRVYFPPGSVSLPGEFHGQRNLAGYSPWGPKVRHD